MCRPQTRTRRRALARAAVAAALCALAATAPAAIAQTPAEPDCDGPAGDPAPGTPQWHDREAGNVFCGEQRSRDTAANPAFAAAALEVQARYGRPVAIDPFRDPAVLGGRRFRHEAVTFPDAAGQELDGLLFRPCDASCPDRPAGLAAYRPPYPGVVIVHGGAATQEMYMWGAQALAESGYMVLTAQVPNEQNTGGGDGHLNAARAALDHLLATPRARAGGAFNPYWAELDREHIGLAGHSAGGVAVSRLGQEDGRVSAIASWDRAQSRVLPGDLRLRTPALYVVADFNCQQVPICLPEAYPEPPDPHGPGNKDVDFQRTSAAGVDTMKIALRAATHLDFTEFAPTPPSSRYGAIVTSYYTLAWFDRYLKGDGLARLVATRFDGSADRHYISGGRYDARTARNVPAQIGGRPVRDRLSFHFRSAYFFHRGRVRCDDMRAGCPAVPAARSGDPPRAPCTRPRFSPRAAPVRRGRVRLRPRVVCRGRARRVVVRLSGGRRPARVVAGRTVTLRVPARRRRLRATFAVDGRRHAAGIALRRAAVNPRLTG